MPPQFRDVALNLLTALLVSPVAVICFRFGVPIELIVFGLLIVSYKAPTWAAPLVAKFSAWRAGAGKPQPKPSEPAAKKEDAKEQDQDDSKKVTGKPPANGSQSWRLGWRKTPGGSDSRKGGREGEDANAGQAWRRGGADAKAQRGGGKGDESGWRKPEAAVRPSALGIKKTPQMQWRAIINKFTPEKFDKLCEQLLETLPGSGSTPPAATTADLRTTLSELLALIFEASSKQHQYSEMYTNLCQKVLDFTTKQCPDLEGKSCIWDRCRTVFQAMVLTQPKFPDDLDEEELMDKKVKHKHMMVGTVKFGGDLVRFGLVPAEGVMNWIHALLSEKQNSNEGDNEEVASQDHTEKDLEQREVQLELLCAIFASMGSSLGDRNTWSEDDRRVIEEVFLQLERLAMDTQNLSLRIRCLIRDVLDLRMAAWKEKEGKLKPKKLEDRRKDDEDDCNDNHMRQDAPEFVPGNRWSSDRMMSDSARGWLDPALLAALQAVEHHLEVIDDKDQKVSRLKALIQLYHLINQQQIVIVANSGNVKRVLDLVAESFQDLDVKSLDQYVPEATRKRTVKGFETGETAILVMASEVSTRRDFDLSKAASVLVNFDFPMTLQLYLYRIYKKADSSTHVYTFFSPQFDVRHTSALISAMEGAKQKVPPALQKLKDAIKPEAPSGGRTPGGKGGRPKGEGKGSDSKGGAEPRFDADDEPARGSEGVPPWKSRKGGKPDGEGREEAQGDWEDRGHGERDRARTEGDLRGASRGKGKGAKSDSSWREGRREEFRDEARREDPSTPSMRGGDLHSRRITRDGREPPARECTDPAREERDLAKDHTSTRQDGRGDFVRGAADADDGNPEEWSRPKGQGKRSPTSVGGPGRGRAPGGDRPDRPAGDESRHERAPWFEQSPGPLDESREAPRGESRPDRKPRPAGDRPADAEEMPRPRPAGNAPAASAGVRQRRPEAPGDPRRERMRPGTEAPEPSQRDDRARGSDRHGGPSQSRGQLHSSSSRVEGRRDP